jgi:hypothetical protein
VESVLPPNGTEDVTVRFLPVGYFFVRTIGATNGHCLHCFVTDLPQKFIGGPNPVTDVANESTDICEASASHD